MRKLVFATNNKHKLKEVSEITGSAYQIVGLSDIGCTDEIPETSPTIESNALQKSRYIYDKYGVDCFSDDTGLEVEALNGAPGVHSARFAGNQCNSEENIDLLLLKLENIENRKARFRTVISLILGGKEYSFEGVIEGVIAKEREGNGGFGYDSVFIPEGYDISFASMGDKVKNRISHRAKATEKLCSFLNTLAACETT